MTLQKPCRHYNPPRSPLPRCEVSHPTIPKPPLSWDLAVITVISTTIDAPASPAKGLENDVSITLAKEQGVIDMGRITRLARALESLDDLVIVVAYTKAIC